MNPKINLIIFILTFVLAVIGFVYLNNKISAYESRLGSTITTIQANDLISDSRTTINDNLANLNADKLESGSSAATLTITTFTNSVLSSGVATVGNLISTSTATSTFAGGISSKIGLLSPWIDSGFGLFGSLTATSTTASSFAGSLGIATTSPSTELSVTGSATTTLYLNSSTANAGGCIQFKAANGTGAYYAYATTSGPLILQVGTCK